MCFFFKHMCEHFSLWSPSLLFLPLKASESLFARFPHRNYPVYIFFKSSEKCSMYFNYRLVFNQ